MRQLKQSTLVLLVLVVLILPAAASAQPACTDTAATPAIEAVGSRYLKITLIECTGNFAIQVLPETVGDRIGLYVQAYGQLGTSPFYRSFAQWGQDVYARGAQIGPDATFSVRLVDADGVTGPETPFDTTWRFGDTDGGGSTLPGLDDLLCVLDAVQGFFSPSSGCTLHGADIAGPCECAMPDGTIDQADVDAILDALSGASFPCPACRVLENFENGDPGWDGSGSTCTTGDFVVGPPNGGNGILQPDGDHTTGSGNAIFTDFNTSPGNRDVDGGVCVTQSPAYPVSSKSDVAACFFHGQRDTGDDPNGDFFRLEISTDGGTTWGPMFIEPSVPAWLFDAASDPDWRIATASVSDAEDLMVRVQVSDAAGPGDIIEGGLDDLVICPAN